MEINEAKYHGLFINKFKVNPNDLSQELARIKNEYGNSEEIKLEFYSQVFAKVIEQFKREVKNDKNYVPTISILYNYFIESLEEDKLDASKYKNELKKFITNSVVEYKPSEKIYNLNSKYGRRKAREQAHRNYENGTPEYRREIDNIRWIIWLVIGGIALAVFFLRGRI